MSESINILYVEDNEGDVELMRMSLDRYCASLNIVLDVVETVAEAKVIFQHGKHVIVLIDEKDYGKPFFSALEKCILSIN